MKTTMHSWALILIAVALAGAGISYHFTLESRFSAIEQKLDQNTVALQQYQISQDTVISSKTEILSALSKEVDALESSLAPLGKTTADQNTALTDLRKEIAALQQSQQAQIDAEKRLAEYSSQVEALKRSVSSNPTPSIPVSVPIPVTTPASTPIPAATAVVTAPAPVTPAPAPATTTTLAPVPTAATTTHASVVHLPLPPMADDGLDIRPAQTSVAEQTPIRVLPVALPVELSTTDIGR